METVTNLLVKLLSHPKIPNALLKAYKTKSRFWNYALICGFGILINQVTIHFFIRFFPLWIANFLSIFLAWMWNYQNALGSLAKYWGMEDD